MKHALAALCLFGCNQVFGIRDTVGPPPSDFDHDGVPDEDDNCPQMPNADQADADHDGFGDACDPCPMGPQSGSDGDHDGIDDACDACLTGANHEEDGDGFLDGCDLCPGDVDPGQADKDGDGIGDACDPDDTTPIAQHRVFFDSFDPPAPGWQYGFEQWVVAGGSMGPAVTPPQAYEGPWNPAAAVDGTSWMIATLIDLPPVPVDGNVVGLFLYDTQGAANTICALVASAGAWYRPADTTPTTTGPTLRIEMFARPDPNGNIVYCSFDHGAPIQTGTIGSTTSYAGLTGVAQARFHWLDVAR